MVKLDGMLMIGSAGANVGKTELACAILREFSKKGKIVGIKVTAVQEKNGNAREVARVAAYAHHSKAYSVSPKRRTQIPTKIHRDSSPPAPRGYSGCKSSRSICLKGQPPC